MDDSWSSASGRRRVPQPLRNEVDERLFRLQDLDHVRGRPRHDHTPRLLLQVRVRLHARPHMDPDVVIMRADSFFEHESDSEFNSTKDLVDRNTEVC